ncbi:hypothetical protein EDB89DRAFT_2238922 [Lactarius sanguifluus]|nr:hypothetical protein EDB89DRAFT_2238922 [Lactarius sanguifluus]
MPVAPRSEGVDAPFPPPVTDRDRDRGTPVSQPNNGKGRQRRGRRANRAIEAPIERTEIPRSRLPPALQSHARRVQRARVSSLSPSLEHRGCHRRRRPTTPPSRTGAQTRSPPARHPTTDHTTRTLGVDTTATTGHEHGRRGEGKEGALARVPDPNDTAGGGGGRESETRRQAHRGISSRWTSARMLFVRRREMGDGDEEMGTEGDEISLRGIINQSARWIGLASRVLVCGWDWDWDWDLWTFLAQVPASLPAPFQPPPREILHESEGRGEVHVPTHSHAPIPSLVGAPRGRRVFGRVFLDMLTRRPLLPPTMSSRCLSATPFVGIGVAYFICLSSTCVPGYPDLSRDPPFNRLPSPPVPFRVPFIALPSPAASRPLRLTAESPWTKLGLSSNRRCTVCTSPPFAFPVTHARTGTRRLGRRLPTRSYCDILDGSSSHEGACTRGRCVLDDVTCEEPHVARSRAAAGQTPSLPRLVSP